MSNTQSKLVKEKSMKEENIFNNLRYICESASIITESLHNQCEVVQMPNGEIIVTEVKAVTTRHVWDASKQKFTKVNQI